MLYRTLMAFHVIAIISWMAGILYLFRLFVYHAAERESVVKERFALMERRLWSVITLPAMIVALLLGISMLALNPALLRMPWMHAKLGCVLLLIGVTLSSVPLRRDLAAGRSRRSERFFRILNEVPTLLMVAIVLFVILKPFW